MEIKIPPPKKCAIAAGFIFLSFFVLYYTPLDFWKFNAESIIEAFSEAFDKGVMIDFILAFIVFCAPFFCPKPAKPSGDEPSIRKILYWKYLSDSGWRICFTVLFLVLINLFWGHYELHEKDRLSIDGLTQATNSMEIELSLEKYRLNELLDVPDFNKKTLEIETAAYNEFKKNNYKESKLAYEMTFKLQADEHYQAWPGYPDEMEARQWPYYLVAKLNASYEVATNSSQAKSKACDMFNADVAEKTNKIQSYISNKYSSSWFSKKAALLTAIDNFKQAERVAPDEVTNVINDAIKTMSEQSKRALDF